jgi:transcription antitermination protein NusB
VGPQRQCKIVRRKDPRHRAREAALQILYQWDVGRGDVDRAADTFFSQQWPDPDPPAEELRSFASRLAHDTVERLDAIDPLIADTTDRWRPERMAVLDRLILRMSVCELLRDHGTPAAVVINEALELARTFSTEESVRFINGMLDAIRKKLEAFATTEGAEDAEGKS